MNLSSTRVYSIVPSTEGHSLGFFPSDPPSPNWKSAEPIATIIKGIVVIGLWTAVASWAILKVVGLVTDLRVSEEEEYSGLDVTEHEERSYDLS